MQTWIVAATVLVLGNAGTTGHESKQDKQQQTKQTQSGSILQQEELQLDQLSKEQVTNLQQKLKERGFYEGEVDGQMDQDVRSAWNRFQESEGMEASDRIDQRSADLIGFTIITVQPVRGTESAGKAPKAAASGKTLTFEVLGVDRENRMVYFTRKDLGEIGVERGELQEADPEIWLQSGRDFAMTFQQLENAVSGDKKGAEIAQELHEGENVRVTTNDRGRVIRLEY